MALGMATDSGTTSGNYLNDCYGTTTQTAGTAITRVIPPRSGAHSCVGNWKYTAAATAHTITMMVTLVETSVASEVASGATTVTLATVPTAADGSILASGDYLIMQYEDGSWASFLVSGLSGLVATIPTTSQKILKSTPVYFMGAPADHTTRQFTVPASGTYDFIASDYRIRAATSLQTGQPILVHSNNATNAGTLYHVSYYFD